MRKQLIILASAAAITFAPVAMGHDNAKAGWSDLGKFLGAMAVTAIIIGAVRAGQNHCHPGYGCHSHLAAGPYHYHDAYGRIVYDRPVVVAPPPPPPPRVYGGGYPQAHYQWCANKYRTYDPGSNTYQPFGPYPRRACRSPYM